MKIEKRFEYGEDGLVYANLPAEPVTLFESWYTEAEQFGIREPHAMTLATADQAGRPSARTVLLREVDSQGFRFYTNYNSRKGRDLAANPNAALVFYWREVDRQVTVRGIVQKESAKESDKYFQSRPRDSQIGAWASNQDQVIVNRAELINRVATVTERYDGQDVPRPVHWGGYLLVPDVVEFWHGRPSRLHDRFQYTRTVSSWEISRLSP